MNPVAAAVNELEQAKADVAAALQQYESAHNVLKKVRDEYTTAEEERMQRSAEVDKLSQKLDATLSSVLNAPEYVIEFQANIGCYQCYVHIDIANETPVLVTIGKQVQLRVKNQTIFKVKFLHEIDAKYSTIRVQKDHIHLRLPLTGAAKEQRQTAMTAGMAARILSKEELEIGSYHTICCKCCEQVLSNDDCHWEKVLPLPSANWMEMVDFWGAAEGAFEYIPKDGIDAAVNRIYVGQSTLLVHKMNLRFDLDLTKTEVRCPKCTTVVGGQEATIQGITLEKYLIKVGDIFADYTVDSVIVTKLLEVIESDGLFRFNLVASDEPPIQIYLQVLSWDATIQSSATTKPQNVVKVLFTKEAQTMDSIPLKELVFPSDILQDVHTRLTESSQLLPASLTGLNNLTIGFLFG
ncbi:hypothetical protein THRCLA_11488, partial [Thraustotheca clavata]